MYQYYIFTKKKLSAVREIYHLFLLKDETWFYSFYSGTHFKLRLSGRNKHLEKYLRGKGYKYNGMPYGAQDEIEEDWVPDFDLFIRAWHYLAVLFVSQDQETMRNAHYKMCHLISNMTGNGYNEEMMDFSAMALFAGRKVGEAQALAHKEVK